MREGAIHLYLASIEAASAAVSYDLPEEDRARVATMHPRRRDEFLATRALSRYAVEKSAGIPVRDQTFGATQNGKPICIGGPAISLSNSEGWVACALSPVGEIGVDLQFTVARIGVERVAAAYFTEYESAWVAAGDRDRFFMLWVLKEAYLKATGQGLGGGLRSVECRIEVPGIEAGFGNGPRAQLLLYAFRDAFVGLAATVRAERGVEFEVLDARAAPAAGIRFVASTA